jgi:integral membrane protein (TIGR03766 family)
MCESKLYSYLARLLSIVGVFWLGIILLGAIQHHNIELAQLPHRFVGAISGICVLSVISLSIEKIRVRLLSLLRVFVQSVKKYTERYVLAIMAITIIYQILLVGNIATNIGFDVGVVFAEVHSKHYYQSYYLSINPNQHFYFFLLKLISSLFPIANQWLLWDIVNLVIIDFSLVMFYFTGTRILGRNKGFVAFVFLCLTVGLTPVVLIPYTDTLVLLPLTVTLWSIAQVIEKLKNDSNYVRYAVLLGLMMFLTYWMKPSAIIPVFAVIIILASSQISRRYKKQLLITLIVSAEVMTVGILGSKLFVYSQNTIGIVHGIETPLSNYLLLGSSGDIDNPNGGFGAYNVHDVRLIQEQVYTHKKHQVAIAETLKRYHDRGVSGTVVFTYYKNRANTDDGTFGWGRTTDFIDSKGNSNEGTIAKLLKSLYYLDGNNLGVFRFISQIIWIVILTMMTMGFVGKASLTGDWLRLSVIGALLFLLIFEGGRTRYLIQFLPVFNLLAAIGIAKLVRYLRGLT